MAWDMTHQNTGVYKTFFTTNIKAAFAFIAIAKNTLGCRSFINSSHGTWSCNIALADWPRYVAYVKTLIGQEA